MIIVDRVNYELFLREFDVFLNSIDNDDELLLRGVDLKGLFISLFGDGDI